MTKEQWEKFVSPAVIFSWFITIPIYLGILLPYQAIRCLEDWWRYKFIKTKGRRRSSGVERILGKNEAVGSNPTDGFKEESENENVN